MSNYWDLFAETGEISFYLLYRETNEEPALPGNTEETEELHENSA